jgi:cytochrome c
MAKVPGTKMAFAGIKNDAEIAALWAYLAQFKADGSKK